MPKKKLKIGQSVAWESDSSGWGVPQFSNDEPDLDNWGTGWGSPDDIWSTATVTDTGGYDDGWSAKAPDIKDEDKFPSLGPSEAPPKKARVAFKPKPKPITHNAYLSRAESSQSGPSWIQNSVNHIKSPPQSRESADNLSNLVRKPVASFNNILGSPPKPVIKSKSSSSEDDFEIINQPASSSKWKPPRPKIAEPAINNVANLLNNKPVQPFIPPRPKPVEPVIPKRPKPAEPVISKPAEPAAAVIPKRPTPAESVIPKRPTPAESVIPKRPTPAEPAASVIPKRPTLAEPVSQQRLNPAKSTIPQQPKQPELIGSRLDLLDPVSSEPVKVPIYTQLVTQLKRLSSKGKPLVYVIQNGNITVSIAES